MAPPRQRPSGQGRVPEGTDARKKAFASEFSIESKALAGWLARYGGVAIALLAALLFLPSLWFGYTLDDKTIVRDDYRLHDLGRPAEYLLTDYWHQLDYHALEYRPATIASFAVDYALWGAHPAGYHALNVALFAVCCGLLWLLVRALFGDALLACTVALLYAMHPLHTEVVAGLVGRAELLMSAGFLAALLLGWRCVLAESTARGRVRRLAGIFLCTLLSISSKEHGVLIPVVMGALLCLPRPHAGQRAGPGPALEKVALSRVKARLRVGLPVFAAMAGAIGIYFIARHHVMGAWLKPVQSAVSPTDNPLVALATGPRLFTALSVLMRAVGLLALPVWPSPDYSPQAIRLVHALDDPMALAGALFVLAMLAGLWTLRRRPAAWLGLVWMFATYLVASNLIVVIGTIFGERLLFLPSIGACLLLAVAAAHLGSLFKPAAAPRIAWGLVLALACCYAVRTLTYEPAWRNDEALFTYGVRRMPRSARMQLYYANTLAEQKQWQAAEPYYVRAVELNPEFLESNVQLAQCYLLTGRVAKGLDILMRLHFSSPGEPRINERLAQGLVSEKRDQEARNILAEGYAAAPKSARNAFLLGTFLVDHNQPEVARPLLEQALPQLAPADQTLVRKLLKGKSQR